MKAKETKGFYEFGEFRLDLTKRRLVRGEEIIPLTPKEFELLLALVENAGRVVEKDELLEKIWSNTFVEEGTLTRNVSWLRKKLGGEKIIETLPRRGYRFLPAVTKIEPPAHPALIVEEQSLQQITIEETISLPEIENEVLALPSNAVIKRGEREEIEKIIRKPETENQNRWFWLGAIGVSFIALAAIFAVYQFVLARQTPKTILVSRVVPFSGLPGRETTPAFSPDGKQIAFAWNGGDGEQLDVYVSLIGGGEPVRLTKNEADELFPSFSPDGKQIAFLRSFPSASEIFLIPALGGAERRLCRLNSIWSSFSFSPDGKTLAVVDAEASGKPNGIFLVNVENGEKRRLTTPPDFASDNMPAFSPDGKMIAFVRAFGTTVYEIFVASVDDGSKPRQLTFDKAGIHGLTWNRDGKQIVFASQRASGQSNLWQIAATGGEPELIATGGKNVAAPALSPDGKTLAFAEESSDINIWRLRKNEGGRKRRDEGGGMRDERNLDKNEAIHPSSFIPHPLIRSSRADHSPHFSPDGARMVFVSDRTGKYEIWIADAEGKNQRQLTDSPASAGSPRFSPDGKMIVYDAQTEGKGDIFVVSAEGGTPRRLTATDSHDVLPAWSADGRFIYFNSDRGGDRNLWKIAADGGEAVQITRQGAFESFAAPDGREIYYTKGRNIAGIWRVPVDGGEETPVGELSEAGYWRYWTATKEGIYFVRRSPNAPFKIEFYDFASKQIKEIADTDRPPIWIFSGLSASADGKTFLYAQYDQIAGNIMLAELAK